jgi:hypothetical protein
VTSGGSRKGAGRPPKPLTEKRRHRVAIYLTDAEFNTWAYWAGCGPSEPIANLVRRAMAELIDRMENP